MPEINDTPAADNGLSKTKILTIVALLVAFSIGWYLSRDWLTLAKLAEQESNLRTWYQENPARVLASAFLLYVVVAALSIPAAAPVLSLTYAWFFKFWTALVLVSFASTVGATLAFLISRYLLRNWVQQRFAQQADRFNRAMNRDGTLFLLSMRLVPAIPFFLVNLVMGLTRIRTTTYWWVSQLGMLPGTAVYLYAGAAIPDIATLQDKGLAVFDLSQFIQITVAFTLLGLFPIAVKKALPLLKSYRRRQDA